MSAFTVAFVLLMWLPGHLLLRLAETPSAAVPSWSRAERLFGEVALSGLSVLWISVTLGVAGFFTRAALVGCGALLIATLAVVVTRRDRPLLRSFAWRPDAALGVVVALIAVAALWYQPSFEQVAGGRDPVTYMVSGIHTARSGSWVVDDEVVRSIGEELREVLLGPDQRETYGHWSARFLGWYLMDPDTGRVVPQGLPLYPAAIAIGYLLGGVHVAVRVTTILAIAAVIGLFFLGRRLLNTAVGITAAALLLVSPAQVWFSRFANAETIAQVLVILGLYGLVMHRRHRLWAYGLLAALAFGLSWQAHILMVWLALPLVGIFVADLLRGRVDSVSVAAFWVPLFLLGVQALLIYVTVTTAYLWGVYSTLKWSLGAIVPAVVGAVLILVMAAYWGRRRTVAADGAVVTTERVGWGRTVTAAAVVVGAASGYVIRPMVSDAWAADSVQRLTLAVSLAAFVFAVSGVAALLLDRRRGDVTLCVLAVALGIIVPILWHPGIQPPLMWSLRRYQTFLPLVYLFAAVPLWTWGADAGKSVKRWGWEHVAMLIVVMFLLTVSGLRGWDYRGFKETGNTIAVLDDIAATLEEDAVLLFEARSEWGVLDFAAPLAYWKGFEVYWVHAKDPPAGFLRDFVRRQEQRGRTVYFFTQGFTYFFAEPRAEPHRRWRYRRQQLEEVWGRMPERAPTSDFPFSVYRLEPSGVNGPLDGEIDVGDWDDMYVGESLPWEVAGEITARWTKGRAFFWLPGMPAGVREIVVRADTVTDSESLGRSLRARLDGVDLGELPIVAGWPDYIFEVPSDWQPVAGQAPTLELTTEPIQPDAVNGNGDTRYLGVLVDAIRWR
jgi:hypothetical protein